MPFKRNITSEEFSALTLTEKGERMTRDALFSMYLRHDPQLPYFLYLNAGAYPNSLWQLIQDVKDHDHGLIRAAAAAKKHLESGFPALEEQVNKFFFADAHIIEKTGKPKYKNQAAFIDGAIEYCNANPLPKVSSVKLSDPLVRQWLKPLKDAFPSHWRTPAEELVHIDKMQYMAALTAFDEAVKKKHSPDNVEKRDYVRENFVFVFKPEYFYDDSDDGQK